MAYMHATLYQSVQWHGIPDWRARVPHFAYSGQRDSSIAASHRQTNGRAVMRKIALGFGAGFSVALVLVAVLFWAGDGWRFGMASRDMYGVICQGLNTVWYGSAV
jgi:hypothetical protein